MADAILAATAKPSVRRTLRVALAGNPNAGKTTIFNALTGSRHHVGNYPGVTVEKREGRTERGGQDFLFVDLPGTYSLTAYSLDEVVARDFVLDERPDVVVAVMDSTNLERNLYLALQFLELGLPLVGALNMSDEAERRGIRIDAPALSALLGMPLVATAGSTGRGLDELCAAVAAAAAAGPATAGRRLEYGHEVESRLSPLEAAIAADANFASLHSPRWLAVKLLEKDAEAASRLRGHRNAAAIAARAAEATAWIETHYGRDAEIVVAEQRYAYVHGAMAETQRRGPKKQGGLGARIDDFLMGRWLGLPLFVLAMAAIFKATFALGETPRAWLDAGMRSLSRLATQVLPSGPLRSLMIDGIIGGVGGVLSFIPLIVILFLFLSILEDTGYMARAAFITDRLLHRFGLHGQSFLPLILGFGCTVPAIMATRVLKSPRDRILTAMALPFMSCGAKFPVYILLAGAFFPHNAATAVMAVYGAGVLLALLSSAILSRIAFGGVSSPFVMELPPWRLPTPKGLLWHVAEKATNYVKRAGTVILAASVLVWALTAFPLAPEGADRAAALENSAAGRLGHLVEPLVRPLGLDWRLGVAVITGFPAKEIIVSTLGVLYRAGGSEAAGLRESLAADPGLDPLVAFVFMLFVLMIPPCFAALATLSQEFGKGWLAFAVGYLFAVAWTLSFAVYQVGRALGL